MGSGGGLLETVGGDRCLKGQCFGSRDFAESVSGGTDAERGRWGRESEGSSRRGHAKEDGTEGEMEQ
jgi:hypothetical protein